MTCGWSSSTSTRTPTRRRSRCWGGSPPAARTFSSSATRTSPSTRSAARRHQHPRVRPAGSAAPTVVPPVGSRWTPAVVPGPCLVAASRTRRGRIPLPGLRSRSPRPPRLKAAPVSARSAARSPCACSVPGPRGYGHRRPAPPGAPDRRHRWGSMAVLVRSTRAAGPLVRALADAGVPAETPSDEVPLARESTSRRSSPCSGWSSTRRAGTRSAPLALLTSPLGGADALQVRRLRHAVLHRGAGRRAARGGRGSCWRRSCRIPRRVAALPERLRTAPGRISLALRAGAGGRRRRPAGGGRALGGVGGQRLAAGVGGRVHRGWRVAVGDGAAAGSGVRAAARHADRQLDAMVALFEAAARFGDRLPGARRRSSSTS